MSTLFDLVDRLPDFVFALVVLASTLGPVAVVGAIIFKITGAI